MKYKLLFALLLGSLGLEAQDITSDLVLQLNFSNEITDITENVTPIPSGLETFVEDRDGNAACAVSFSGSANEYIIIPGTADNGFVQGDEVTVSLWFKMNNVDPANYETLFIKGNSTTSGFEMALFDLNTPVIGDITNGLGIWDYDWNSDPDLPTDITNWHHFVMVISNTSVKLYRDNILRNTYDYTGDGFNIGTNILNYQIGRYFIGAVDDIRAYRRALTADEVSLLYNLDGNCSTLSSGDPLNVNNVVIVEHDGLVSLKNLPKENVFVSVYEITGKEVFSSNSMNTENNSIDFSNLQSGLYILSINNQGNTSSFKFIIQ
ncbi:T9SS type A sorting domain-containing protein [Aureisphaera galaxeae]|uniref:LamG-like jellyroll fold domain-containing protein n=1 Tax=Aureisphaera galaxeae TaxID=1538023 RepID=UPI00234FF38E|nr:LamG-like jellyroll fold domain-containing protein [Aureisphaera galaxeae]MDC8004995.1 T9SS type A sorting domain-containing protein [Aureisphaera galaxeae]